MALILFDHLRAILPGGRLAGAEMNAIIDKAIHHRPKNLIKQIAATGARVWREQPAACGRREH
jgi:hypothetical protein